MHANRYIDCVNKARLFINSILLVDTLITRITCQYRYRIEFESLDKSKLLASTRKKKAKKHLGRIIVTCNFEILENQSLRSYHMFVEWGISFLLEKTNLGRRKKRFKELKLVRKAIPNSQFHTLMYEEKTLGFSWSYRIPHYWRYIASFDHSISIHE